MEEKLNLAMGTNLMLDKILKNNRFLLSKVYKVCILNINRMFYISKEERE